MALSEEEQRLLDQLEASLVEQDPKLAHTFGSNAKMSRQVHKSYATVAGVLFLVGIVLLVVGLRTVWVFSVVGFVAMFAATVVGLTSWQKVAPEKRSSVQARTGEPFMERMEERWRRRQQGGF